MALLSERTRGSLYKYLHDLPIYNYFVCTGAYWIAYWELCDVFTEGFGICFRGLIGFNACMLTFTWSMAYAGTPRGVCSQVR